MGDRVKDKVCDIVVEDKSGRQAGRQARDTVGDKAAESIPRFQETQRDTPSWETRVAVGNKWGYTMRDKTGDRVGNKV